MTFLYFAYGSNLWLPRIIYRCPSARHLDTGVLAHWAPTYEKPSTDGSAKLNITPREGGEVEGVIYVIEGDEGANLDAAEPGYNPIRLEAMPARSEPVEVLTYRWEGEEAALPPYDWYVSMVVAGAGHHGLSPDYIREHLLVPGVPDPAGPRAWGVSTRLFR